MIHSNPTGAREHRAHVPSYLHRGSDQPLIGVTTDVFLQNVMRRFADRDAVVSLPQNVRLTYGDLDEETDRLARGLIAIGVQRGSRVGIWSTNNVEWLLLQLATARVGAVLVNINPACRTSELAHALRTAKVEVLFLIPSFRNSEYVDMVLELCPEAGTADPEHFAARELPGPRRLVLYDPEHPGIAPDAPRGFLTWTDVLERGHSISDETMAERRAALDPDDPANIQFTSGTTGEPKAVVLSQHSLLNNAWFTGEALGFTENDRLCAPVPFYHCFGMVVSNLVCLTHGAAIVIPSPHFDPAAALDAVARERCTAIHGVPTMFVAELEQPDFERYDLSSLRTGIMAGAPCPPPLMRQVIDEMGCTEILIAYGMTETSPVTHITGPGDSLEQRTDTVGTNLPHQEVKIVDPETGAVVPRGERGEICFRGYHLMRGYDGQPEATRETIDSQGWLHSGDLGVMENDGYVRITGRLKNMIIRGGENIYPAEIESFYMDHPKIAEVAVFGIADEKYGEEVCAWVRPHTGSTIDPEEIRAYGKGRIAHFKIPRVVRIVDSFPMTPTGKIQKFRMREMMQREEARLVQ